MLFRVPFIILTCLLALILSGVNAQGNTTSQTGNTTSQTENTTITTPTGDTIYESSIAPSNYPTPHHGDKCRCPGANLKCVRQERGNSTNGMCPPCPTSCSTPDDPECSSSVECASGRDCQIRDDSSYKCELESGVGEKCSYLDSCFDNGDCEMLLRGSKLEQTCSPGLFCRQVYKLKCIVIGQCVSISNASYYEARCLRNPNTISSRCSLDGNYLCSTTEHQDDDSVIQTCYNITSGEIINTVNRRRQADVLQEDCRRRNLATCRTNNGIAVLSGDTVEDSTDRCNYCLCKDGVIDRSECKTNPRCVQTPDSCTMDGRTVSHGRVLNSRNGCAQMRCVDGTFVKSTLDEDCDGIDDVDPCIDQRDTDLVCALSSGIRTHVPKCKAIALGANYSNGRCGEDEVCDCESDEICVSTTKPRDMCIAADESGCKSKRCIPIDSNVTCSTGTRNTPVCSSSGISYNSECEAFVNQDFDVKYIRACDDVICEDNNNGEGFCGYDNVTYDNLCQLEFVTGDTIRDYNGRCEMRIQQEVSIKCERIPEGCEFTTRASDSRCPIPGAQGVLHIDVDEVQEYAFRKGKSEVDIRDVCREAESDWEILTGYPVYNDKCEFTCRHKYDTVGAVVVQVKAVSGRDCVECGKRLREFIERLREDKSGDVVSENRRRRRQTEGSESSGSGLFISPSELENDSSLQNAASSITASLLIILICFMLIILL